MTAPVVRPGVVTVILVNYKGADDTITALRAFDDVDWPADRLELVVVDNDSGDDSRGADPGRRARAPWSSTRARTPGSPAAATSASRTRRGEYVAFLNNDARPDEGWVRAAVEVLEQDPTIGSVASKVLDWDGKLIDYVDGSLTWFGMGYKREVEKPDTGAWDIAKDVLFGTGAAMFVRAELYREVGGFDERFFMFYEDVDLGWRLNLLGHRVRYVPGSVAFHKHHVTMKKFGNFRESYLLERNALLSMYKNYDDESLARALPAAMALAVRRSVARTGVDATALDLQRSPGGDDVGTVEIPKMALTGPYAIDYFVEQLPDPAGDPPRPAGAPAAQRPRPVPAVPRDDRARLRHAGVPGRARGAAARRSASSSTSRPGTASSWSPASRCSSGWRARRSGRGRSPRPWLPTTTCGWSPRPAPSARARDFAVEYAAGTGLREPTEWADVDHLPGLPAGDGAVAQGQRQGDRRRRLRPDAPRAARAGEGPRCRGSRRTRST